MNNAITALLLGFVLFSSAMPAQSAELSSLELEQAASSLRTFELSGTAVPKHKPFKYTEGEFPRLQLEKELKELKTFFNENDIRLSIMMTNAFKRQRLSDPELVVTVRSGRNTSTRIKSYLEKEASK